MKAFFAVVAGVCFLIGMMLTSGVDPQEVGLGRLMLLVSGVIALPTVLAAFWRSKRDSAEQQEFLALLPSAPYRFYRPGAGIAVDPKTHTIALYDGANKLVVPADKVRTWRWEVRAPGVMIGEPACPRRPLPSDTTGARGEPPETHRGCFSNSRTSSIRSSGSR